MDLLLPNKKKISSKSKKLENTTSNFSITSLGVKHINDVLKVSQIDIDSTSFEFKLKQDWTEFIETYSTLMNRKI